MTTRHNRTQCALDNLWHEYAQSFSASAEMPLQKAVNMARYHTELALAMHGSAANAIQRRKRRLQF